MNVVEIIGYILVALGAYRLYVTQGTCPGGWASLVIGVLLIWQKPRLNV
jgi:hypothetical protein